MVMDSVVAAVCPRGFFPYKQEISAVVYPAYLCGFHTPLACSLIAALSSGKAEYPSGVMVLYEVAIFSPHYGFRQWIVSNAWYGLCGTIHIPAASTRSINLHPFGTWLPASSGENSGQAMVSFVPLNSVSFFHCVSISTAIFRAVATAALANPRRPASLTAQLLSAKNRCTRLIEVLAASTNALRMALSPHLRCGRTSPSRLIDIVVA